MIRGTIIFVTITVFLIFYILKRNNVIEGFYNSEKYLDKIKSLVAREKRKRKIASDYDVLWFDCYFHKNCLPGWRYDEKRKLCIGKNLKGNETINCAYKKHNNKLYSVSDNCTSEPYYFTSAENDKYKKDRRMVPSGCEPGTINIKPERPEVCKDRKTFNKNRRLCRARGRWPVTHWCNKRDRGLDCKNLKTIGIKHTRSSFRDTFLKSCSVGKYPQSKSTMLLNNYDTRMSILESKLKDQKSINTSMESNKNLIESNITEKDRNITNIKNIHTKMLQRNYSNISLDTIVNTGDKEIKKVLKYIDNIMPRLDLIDEYKQKVISMKPTEKYRETIKNDKSYLDSQTKPLGNSCKETSKAITNYYNTEKYNRDVITNDVYESSLSIIKINIELANEVEKYLTNTNSRDYITKRVNKLKNMIIEEVNDSVENKIKNILKSVGLSAQKILNDINIDINKYETQEKTILSDYKNVIGLIENVKGIKDKMIINDNVNTLMNNLNNIINENSTIINLYKTIQENFKNNSKNIPKIELLYNDSFKEEKKKINNIKNVVDNINKYDSNLNTEFLRLLINIDKQFNNKYTEPIKNLLDDIKKREKDLSKKIKNIEINKTNENRRLVENRIRQVFRDRLDNIENKIVTSKNREIMNMLKLKRKINSINADIVMVENNLKKIEKDTKSLNEISNSTNTTEGEKYLKNVSKLHTDTTNKYQSLSENIELINNDFSSLRNDIKLDVHKEEFDEKEQLVSKYKSIINLMGIFERYTKEFADVKVDLNDRFSVYVGMIKSLPVKVISIDSQIDKMNTNLEKSTEYNTQINENYKQKIEEDVRKAKEIEIEKKKLAEKAEKEAKLAREAKKIAEAKANLAKVEAKSASKNEKRDKDIENIKANNNLLDKNNKDKIAVKKAVTAKKEANLATKQRENIEKVINKTEKTNNINKQITKNMVENSKKNINKAKLANKENINKTLNNITYDNNIMNNQINNKQIVDNKQMVINKNLENALLEQAAEKLKPSDIKTNSKEVLKSVLRNPESGRQTIIVGDNTQISNGEIVDRKTRETTGHIKGIGGRLNDILVRLDNIEQAHNKNGNHHVVNSRENYSQKVNKKETTKNIAEHNRIVEKQNNSKSNEIANTDNKYYHNANTDRFNITPKTDSANFSYKPNVEFNHMEPSKKIMSAYGWSYMPPQFWSVPQKRPPACIPSKKNTETVVPIYDKSTPVDALDWTQVGSILPKYEYEEVHNPNYYHPGWIAQDTVNYPIKGGKKSTKYYNMNKAKPTNKN